MNKTICIALVLLFFFFEGFKGQTVSYTTVNGLDFPYNDIAFNATMTLTECKGWCTLVPNCRGIVLFLDNGSGCWIKTDLIGPVLNTQRTALVKVIQSPSGTIQTLNAGFKVVQITSLPGIGTNAMAFDSKINVLYYIYGNLLMKMNSDRSTSIVAGCLTSSSPAYGVAGYNGDNIQANTAMLNFPGGVAVDSSSNIFISDTLNNRIRRVDFKTNIITTIAGNGNAGNTGNTGPGKLALVNGPTALVINPFTGSLYFCDTNNQVTRKFTFAANCNLQINENCTITSSVGNGTAGFLDNAIAQNGMLNLPTGLSFGSDGREYISDTNNNRIRVKNFTSGGLLSEAGNGQAGYSANFGLGLTLSLNAPTGMVSDALGNIFFADTSNNAVRSLNVVTGQVNLVAGRGVSASYGSSPLAFNLLNPSALAIDNCNNLIISQFATCTIVAIVPPNLPPPSHTYISSALSCVSSTKPSFSNCSLPSSSQYTVIPCVQGSVDYLNNKVILGSDSVFASCTTNIMGKVMISPCQSGSDVIAGTDALFSLSPSPPSSTAFLDSPLFPIIAGSVGGVIVFIIIIVVTIIIIRKRKNVYGRKPRAKIDLSKGYLSKV